MSEQYVAEFLQNTDSRLIIGMLGTGAIFAWFSELVFSLIALMVEKIRMKIKGATKNNVWHYL